MYVGRLHEIVNVKIKARGCYTVSFVFDVEPGSQTGGLERMLV